MCYRPILIKVKEEEEGSKARVALFFRQGEFLEVPCRKCLECRQARSREWQLRLMKEAEGHRESCFITLTYKSSPIVLQRRDLTLFLKKLRKRILPRKVRYFACGEYGDVTERPHFHICLFGYSFPDKKQIEESDRGNVMFMSKMLTELWGKGRCVVQDLTPESASYCTLYATKHKKLSSHLVAFPEYNVMSKSLGVDKIMERIDVYSKTDEIYVRGFRYKIPKIILDKMEDRKSVVRIKFERQKAVEKNNRILLRTGIDWNRTRAYRKCESYKNRKIVDKV